MEIKPFYSGRMAYDITGDNGEKYVFVPQEFAQKGFTYGDGVQWYEPEFLKPGAFDKAAQFTLPDDSAISAQAKELYKNPTQGYIWKAEDYAPVNSDDFRFQSYEITPDHPALNGLGKVNGQMVYSVTAPSPGWQQTYMNLNSEGAPNFHSDKVTPGRSILGDLFGGIGDTVAGVVNSGLDALQAAGPLGTIGLNYAMPGLGTALSAGAAAGRGDLQGALTSAAIGEVTGNSLLNDIGTAGPSMLAGGTSPNAVGGVTGPDNIDVGGGFSPAAGATAAELEAARVALEQAPEVVAPELTAQQVLDQITAEQSAAMTAQETQAMIDEEAANAAKEAAATPAQVAAAKAAGMTVADYLKAGLLVNALTGDPLGLGGSKGQQGGAASTGFAQVPIPAEWKSPTYAAPSAPIDLSTIFSNQNMLGGTQWQGLPSQQNVSFNDIFAAGQQQTPMGSPVDLNQIVSSILGQAATSQKPA